LILLLMLYLLRKSVKRSLSVGPGQNHVPAWLTLAHAGIYCWDHQDISKRTAFCESRYTEFALGITNERERLSVPNHPFLTVVAINGVTASKRHFPRNGSNGFLRAPR
jgi:hypothetical protein